LLNQGMKFINNLREKPSHNDMAKTMSDTNARVSAIEERLTEHSRRLDAGDNKDADQDRATREALDVVHRLVNSTASGVSNLEGKISIMMTTKPVESAR